MTGERPPDEDLVPPEEEAATPESTELAQPEPFPEPAASERISGPTTPAVVPQETARAIAGDETWVYVDDRVSKVWVVLIVGTFLAILAWGLLGGHAGLLSAKPTPEPTLAPTPSLTASPPASPTASPAASPAASPSGSPAASPTSAPAASPTAPATPTPGPS